MTPNLDGVRIKLARAHRHIRELDEVLSPLLKVDPDNFVRDPNGDPTKPVYLVRKVPRLKPEWSAIVGDALYNIRSAWDHLAHQLVVLDNGKPANQTQFPIHRDRPFNKDSGECRRPQTQPPIRSTDIRDAIERVQPYDPGPFDQSHLWAINMLCNTDKHRELLVMAYALNISGPGGVYWGLQDGFPSPSWELSTKPLNDGDPVASFDFHGTEAPTDFEVHLELTVTLDEGPAWNIIRRDPVIDFLDTCGGFTAFTISHRFAWLLGEDYVAFGAPDSRLAPHDAAANIKPRRPREP
jgi:hypothetical protein